MMKYLAIHHTAVSRMSGQSQLKSVNTYHKNKGWSDRPSILGWYVGYNFFIDVNGKNTHTRGIGEETFAVVGHNCNVPEKCDTISVCLAGNYHVETPSDPQIASLRAFIYEMVQRYPNIEITFHRSLQANRTCPGDLFTREYLDKIILQTTPPVCDPVDKEKQIEIGKLQKENTALWSIIKELQKILAKFFKM